MDIISHGLWAGAVYKGVNQKKQQVYRPLLAAWWGVFPDLFAFVPPLLGLLVTGNLGSLERSHPHSGEGASAEVAFFGGIAEMLYQYSHSIIIFLLVFFAVWGIRKWVLRRNRPVWEMGGWLFHILLDIPSHSTSFYPTPFLWPFSDVQVDGIPWSTPWFMVTNIVLLACVYGYFFYRDRGKKSKALNVKS